MAKELTSEILEKVIGLGKLILNFGRIERHTRHEDGVHHETDTDHTVMLGIVACAFAEQFEPSLDRGKIAEFALIHDLVEVYAGDTYSGKILEHTTTVDKEEREAAALTRIRSEFDAIFPWIGETIEAYEKLETPEARYVKVLDKALPKITNILNNGASIKESHTRETMREFLSHQHEALVQGYGSDQAHATELLKQLGDRMHKEVFPAETT